MLSDQFSEGVSMVWRGIKTACIGTKPLPIVKLDSTAQEKWLTEHIPHRLRGALYRYEVPLAGPYSLHLVGIGRDTPPEFICPLSGAHEGRHACMRWLIELLGIKGKGKGRPSEQALSRETDMRLDRLDGGEIIKKGDARAHVLAKVWLGCSQATSHPTEGTGHPSIKEPELNEAALIVIAHLERTVYAASKRSLLKETLGR